MTLAFTGSLCPSLTTRGLALTPLSPRGSPRALQSDALFRQLLFCLSNFAAPLTELFTFTCQQLEAAATANDGPRLRILMEALRLICRIFYSLNWQVSGSSWGKETLIHEGRSETATLASSSLLSTL